jgi:gamma-glutamyltranspeptidase / glutathione hydrolase
MRSRFLSLLAALFALAGCTTVPALAPAPAQAGRGIVSAADPRAAEAGAAMLREGGTAADAALATLLALTVVEPQSSGIGRMGVRWGSTRRSRAGKASECPETSG